MSSGTAREALDTDGLELVSVDEHELRLHGHEHGAVDVAFDEQRVWSLWVERDGQRHGADVVVSWPAQLQRFLDGSTTLTLRRHTDGEVLIREDVQLGSSDARISVKDDDGRPLAIDNSGRATRVFSTCDVDQVAPLLDAIEQVLHLLHDDCGLDAFPGYGTLLGAVRQQTLIGHDSDADLAYLSRFTEPVDVVRESFRIQRVLTDRGYRVQRYSGAAFKVMVAESDGAERNLDVFAGFIREGHLHLMGELRVPFEREWVLPLGTCVLEGRTLPAPADTNRFLSATYGPSWQVPDPAFKFETPATTSDRFDGWFRGMQPWRPDWSRRYSGTGAEARREVSDFARFVLREEQDRLGHVIELGCGRGVDALFYGEHAESVQASDYVPSAYGPAQDTASRQSLPVTFTDLNLAELRATLAAAARFALDDVPRTLVLRHVVDAVTREARRNLFRLADMATRRGGRMYLEFISRAASGEPARRRRKLVFPVGTREIAELAVDAGATVEQVIRLGPSEPSAHEREVARMVLTWRR